MNDQQTVEIVISVRVRSAEGKMIGPSTRAQWMTEPMPKPTGIHTIMSRRQREGIAEGIKDMAKDFVEGHFRDTQP